MTATPALPVPARDVRALVRLYVARAAVAVVWAVVFAATASTLGVAAVVLLIAYPAVDVVASVYDARRHPESAAPQWLNAALSTAALVGVAVATSFDARAVLLAFGLWATVSGLVQVAVAVRRRRQFGVQPAILVSGGLSTVAGIGFAAMSRLDDPMLTNLAGYAALGGVLFAVSAVVLRRRAARA